jgi:hypothetical protein
MEPGKDEKADGGEESRVISDPRDGRDWLVRVSGQSAGGILPLRTVPLLELSFAPAEDPHQPLRRAICRGEGLEGLQDEELLACLRDSNPIPPPDSDPPSKRTGKRKSRFRPR